MCSEKENVKSSVKEDLLWNEAPIYSPLVFKLSTQIETTMKIGNWVGGQEFEASDNWRILVILLF